MKKYRYLLYDWDGCLAKTLQIHLDAYKQTFAEFNIFPSDFEITQKVFGDWNGPAKFGIDDIPTFTNAYLARVVQKFATAPLYPHAKDAIVHFSKTKKIALITTSTITLVKPALEHHGISSFFTSVLTAEDVKRHKPNPEIIELALQKLDGNKQETVIIGDSKSDLGAAQATGIDSVLFYPADHALFYNKQQLIHQYNPTFVIEDHQNLVDIL